jgi:hypothetical protein
MGCDIHIYTERYEPELKQWVCIDNFCFNVWHLKYPEDEPNKWTQREWYTGRNYYLFGMLAKGVRTDPPHGFKLKGFPDNASPHTVYSYEQWGLDAHSASWLTLKELNKKLLVSTLRREDPDNEFARFVIDFKKFLESIHYSHVLTKVPDDHFRIVFWFDN